jgi:hypothetical protein
MDGDAIDATGSGVEPSAETAADATDDEDEAGAEARPPQFRYFGVLGLMLLCVVFLIASPNVDWSRAVAIAIEGAALVLTVATSRQRESVRRRRAAIVGAVMIAGVLLIALGVISRGTTALFGLIITVAIPVALARGLLRLLGRHGVTLQSVAGSLAIYLSIGLIFAWVVGFTAAISDAPYFAQKKAQADAGTSVYFSFTVLTTTGFGDYTPATPAGHAIGVIEMLTGQIYLVTVIGLLIGSFASRPREA